MNNKYPDYIMEKLRQRLGLEADNTIEDEYINSYSNNNAFQEVLMWDGLIHWDSVIKEYVLDIYGVDLNS